MRILGVILVWVVIIGAITFYMTHQTPVKQVQEDQPISEVETATCSFEVTPTFTAEPDPFALSDSGESSALILKLGKRVLLNTSDAIEAGIPLTVGPVKDIKKGTHELYVETSPPLNSFNKHYALRVKVFQDEESVAEKTIWAAPGGKIAGTLQFNIHSPEHKDQHDH